jgi:putative endonuclease
VGELHRSLGARGEDEALRSYLEAGYRLVVRNWRCRIGELDLVLTRGDTLVICEVKTRRGAGFGGGWEAVTAKKQAKIRAVAHAFLIASGSRYDTVRFDVASVAVGPGAPGPDPSGDVQVERFEDAF